MQLARANDDLENLQASVNLPVVIFGIDLRVRSFTPAAAEILGLKASDVGRSVEVIPLRFLYGIESFIGEVIAEECTREQEVQSEAGHWYLLRVLPYRTSDQRIGGAVVVLEDIHEARSVRERLREARDYAMAIVDATTQPLLILDTELRVVATNRAFESTFQVSATDCQGQLLFELGSDQWKCPVLRGVLADIVEKGSSFVGFQIEHNFPHIGRRVMLLNARRMPENGRTREILLAFEDITERQRADAQNRERLAEISAANSAKDHFLATLSHELRMPLTPVLLSVSALEGRADIPEDVREQLYMIRRNVTLESRLIDDLLDLTRVTQGKLTIDPCRVCGRDLLGRAIEIVRELAVRKGVQIELVAAVERCEVMGDPRRLKQLFWNLLSNAIKFTPSGGRITVRVTQEPGGTMRIEVADTGIGIEPEKVPLLFNAFEQGSTKITRQFGGLGLGLAIVRAITELHGGHVWAESNGMGHGSTFVVELPLAVEGLGLPAYPERVEEPEAPAAGLVCLKHQHLLLVEDHHDTAHLMARLLRNLGYEVSVANSVAAARSLASEYQFDLLVSDIGLPDESGIELMRHVRQEYKLPGIALTGFGTERDRAEILAAGFSEVLVKPVDFKQLKAAITRVG